MIDQDLGDAVNRLVAKLSENNVSSSSRDARADNTLITEKIKSLQESLTLAQKEADEAKALGGHKSFCTRYPGRSCQCIC